MANFKKLYDANDALEAHMLFDLLTQQGFQVHIEGEHLQGGIGDLPTVGIVRLMVLEDQYDEAKTFIAEWNRKQSDSTLINTMPIKRFGGISLFFMGFGLGLILMYGYFFFPRYRQATLDEQWTYSLNGNPVQSTIDRNSDGKADMRQYFDARGQLEKVETDDDFDGTFETVSYYQSNNPVLTETDTDHDGFPDLKLNYQNGVMVMDEYIYPSSGFARKRCFYELSLLKRCELDRDLDGKMDTRIEYDSLGEVSKSEKL